MCNKFYTWEINGKHFWYFNFVEINKIQFTKNQNCAVLPYFLERKI